MEKKYSIQDKTFLISLSHLKISDNRREHLFGKLNFYLLFYYYCLTFLNFRTIVTPFFIYFFNTQYFNLILNKIGNIICKKLIISIITYYRN